MTNDTKSDALAVPDFTPVREYVNAQLADHAVAIAMNKAWKLEVQALRRRWRHIGRTPAWDSVTCVSEGQFLYRSEVTNARWQPALFPDPNS